ncbi:UPF0758 domain-containing protein [Caldisericum exile]|uniref:UPF0758 domain-containing protein n=1 Tax=Caldisericum exile TaxID=693075 RepID=UPI0002F671A2|nr:UPF0758 domain-containing protein [Caldisericum exile]
MELNSYESAIEFLARNNIYPVMKNSKVYITGKNAKNLDKGKAKLIIEILSIKSPTDLERVKNDLRNARKKANSHVPIKDWIESERPREALLKNGAETLSLSKLLAIILRTGSDGVSAEELGKRILNKYKSLRALDEAPLKN